MVKSNQLFFNSLLVLSDAATIVLSFILAWFIRFEFNLIKVETAHIGFGSFLGPIGFVLPMYLLIYYLLGLFHSQRNSTLGKEIEKVVKSNIIGFLIFLAVLFTYKNMDYSRLALLIFAVSNTILTISFRSLLRVALKYIRKNGYNIKHVLVVGTGDAAKLFTEKVTLHRYLGYHIIGYLDDSSEVNTAFLEARVIGKIKDMPVILSNQELDEIIIALDLEDYEKLGFIIEMCEKYGVKAEIIPAYFKYIPAKPYVDQIDELHLVNIRYVPLDDAFNKVIKRISDIILSVMGIIIASPILIIVALLIKATSPGSVIFKQVRIGLNRKEFQMYKFRSMRILDESEERAMWTTKDDLRKTRVGEFIRKTSIDELPQLFNVLRGDMSLIGPRPERPYFVEKFRDEIPKYMVKHHVRPGITGWAQVNGYRGNTSIKGRIECDIFYIENWSIWLDVRIIFLTILRGFIHENAY